MANEIRNRWAFLVGVNDYKRSCFDSLKHCVNDVLSLRSLLKDIGFDAVICLHDELDRNDDRFPDEPNTVKNELRKLQDKIGPDDLLLVYFACHGTRSLPADGTKPYLILRDTQEMMEETALSVADLKDEMQQLTAQRQVLILDACYMGMGQDERGDRTEESRQFIKNVHELATGFALLTPSTATQTTRESGDFNHGVFSHFVLKGLRGDGEALESTTETAKRFVTVGSLSRYVANKMLIWAADKGYEQLPQGAKEGGLGDFILVDYRQQALPNPSWSETASATGEIDASRSSEFATEASPNSSVTKQDLGKEMKLKDLKRKLAKAQQRVDYINKKIDEGVDFEEEGKLETRKDGIFQQISELDEEIEQLKQSYD